MTYLERYRNGEYEQVWNELQSLGAAIRTEPYYSQAQAVATETMRRVRGNCERLIARLKTLGYTFGVFPDGTRQPHATTPLVPPTKTSLKDLAELEAQAGPLPLSLVAFWQQVGAVDLIGRHHEWPDGLDPLVVEPPEGALGFLFEGEEAEWFAGLAPDDLHKDNVSGGDPYGVHLPNSNADFLFVNERHNLHFVPYLRLAILQWGGFPGLQGAGVSFTPLANLVADLEPF